MATLTAYRQGPFDGVSWYYYGYHFWYQSSDNGAGGAEDVGGYSGIYWGVGNNGGLTAVDRQHRGGIRFDISGLPAGVVIDSAIMSYYSGPSASAGGSYSGDMYYLNSPGFDGSQIWSAQAGHGAYVASIPDAPDHATRTVDITTAVRAWYAGSVANYGLKIIPSGSGNKVNIIAVTYGGGGQHEPYLTITYSYPPSAPGAFTNPLASQVVPVGPNLAVAWGAASDADTATGSLTYDLDYYNGTTWVDVTTTAAGVLNYSFPTSSLAATANAYFRVRAYDGVNYGAFTQVGPFTIKSGGPRMIVG